MAIVIPILLLAVVAIIVALRWSTFFPHKHSYSNYVCTGCGDFDSKTFATDVKSNTFIEYDGSIYFGTYPQTMVSDSKTISALGGFDSSTWTSYGYYINGEIQNYMYYVDKEYDGEKYRGVYFTDYRQNNITSLNDSQIYQQDRNGFNRATAYWFKYEPIKWDVVEQADGYATIVANLLLDSQEYYISANGEDMQISRTDYQGNLSSAYENNYQYSTIRTWLNTIFYQTAFTDLQQSIIQTVIVDNSTAISGDKTANPYLCADTHDKVWLLSYDQAKTYYFSSESSVFSALAAMQKKGTDYAKSQGLVVMGETDPSAIVNQIYKGNSYWWSRSPSEASSSGVLLLGGDSAGYVAVDSTDLGVAPALKINLTGGGDNGTPACTHSYADDYTCHDRVCIDCGTVLPATTQHTFDAAYTCANRTCAHCGFVQNGDGAHRYTVDYTCADRTCVDCGFIQAATGEHNYSSAYTCVERACTNCGFVQAADGNHTYANNYTCINRTCLGCGQEQPATTQHTFESSFTCVDRTCTICGTVVAATSEHNFENNICVDCGKVKSDDCTHRYADDYTCHDRACIDCGTILAATTEHNFDNDFNCKERTCVDCGFVKSPITEHRFESMYTCVERTCADCGFVQAADGNHTYANDYTCADRICMGCDKVQPATTQHTFEVQYTCADRICANCGSTEQGDGNHRYADDYTCHDRNCLDCGAICEASTQHTFESIYSCTDRVCVNCGTTVNADNNHTYEQTYTCANRTCLGCGFVQLGDGNHNYNVDFTCCNRTCINCGAIQVATADHNLQSGACLVCGNQIFERDGKTIYFGSYPQTVVVDSGITSALGGFDANTWTSYGYYISGEISNYMYYTDKELGGNKYRGVYFTSYRPWYTTTSSSANSSNQDENGYTTSTVYWFKYEPIKWNVVEQNGVYATIVADLVLDSQEYYITEKGINEQITRTDYQGNTATTYENNYQYSSIRTWLNTTFYQTAFNNLQQSLIQTGAVNNSLSSTGDGSNEYICNNTNDKVWLLSYQEANTYFTSNSARQKQGTDYAKSQGLAFDTSIGTVYSYWWLRSPYFDYNNNARAINCSGDFNYASVSDATYGVVPALKILVGNHRYADSFTCHDRTCLDCGYVQAASTDHTYNTANTCSDRTCVNCGYVQAATTQHTYNSIYTCVDRTCVDCGFVLSADDNHTYAQTYTCANRTCLGCGNVAQGDGNHTYADDYTCHNRACVDCGTILAASTEHNIKDGACVDCDYKLFEIDGNSIYFGSYPQSLVTDSTVKNALGTFNPATWTSYGYIISDEVKNFMYYVDTEYNGEKYRGVYFTSYRPYLTNAPSNADNSNQDNNGYTTKMVYWFKYEPIKWTIIEQSNGYATIVADMILDSQEFYVTSSGTQSNRTDYQGNSATAYENNYQYSTIRTWLNTAFYQTAFGTLQQELIQAVTVDNSFETTAYAENPYACANIVDKVWLLSYAQASAVFESGSTRKKKGSDYAKSQGLNVYTSIGAGYSAWWLRSPVNNSICTSTVISKGNFGNDATYCTYDGVVPALTIQICSHRYENEFACVDRTCIDCGFVKLATIEHIYNLPFACQERTCQNCGFVQSPTTEHNYNSPYTCVSRTCLTCGFVQSADTNHTYEQTYTCANRTCLGCGTVAPGDGNHTYADNYTCHDRVCLNCGSICEASTEHTLQNGMCTVCGEKAFERDGDTIYFGTYPQTLVTDTDITTALGGFDESTWTSYGYYIEGEVQDYMYYIDKSYNGEKYRGVYFTSYRPKLTTISSGAGNSDQDNNGYTTSTVYWFKYQPIKWQIVTEEGGYATIVADLILDSQEYYITAISSSQRTRSDYQGNTATVYDNNYQYSTIRSWLNTTFYDTAFSILQQSIIQTVTVDNSAISTGHSNNEYVCDNTNDKVWLLSYKEVTMYFKSKTARQKQGTDYALSQGLWKESETGCSMWWLRSPYYIYRNCARAISNDGNVNYSYVYDTDYGVVPALKLLVCTHRYADDYTCHDRACLDCGAVCEASTEHIFENSYTCVDRTCQVCGYVQTGDGNHSYADDYTCHDRACVDCGTVLSATTEHIVIKGQCSICGEDAVDRAYIIINNDENNVLYMNDLMDDDIPSLVSQYWISITLNADDVVGVFDSYGECTNYEPESKFRGVATVDGDYVFYFKTYEDGGKSIWVAVPENYICRHNYNVDYTCVDRTCSVCGFVQTGDGNHTYAYDYTCHERACLDCGTVITATTAHNFVDYICTICGEHDLDSIAADMDTYLRVGDNIYFGTYPQTLVTDTNITTTLGGFEESIWSSYGYYINGEVQDYMYYIDKSYNGEKYRGVYFTSYRPDGTTSTNNIDRYQYNNGYYISTVYWFKYQPIKWQIVAEEGGYATLVADLILDSQEYYTTANGSQTTRTDYQGNSASAYENNYQYSTIRSWLNTTFYQAAFTELQQSIVQTVTVDNSLSTTGNTSSPYVCDNTKDKVWLLSYAEAATYFTSDATRQKKGSDYALSQGLRKNIETGCSIWWLRSPNSDISFVAWAVYFYGFIFNTNVDYTYYGVVPALKIKL